MRELVRRQLRVDVEAGLNTFARSDGHSLDARSGRQLAAGREGRRSPRPGSAACRRPNPAASSRAAPYARSSAIGTASPTRSTMLLGIEQSRSGGQFAICSAPTGHPVLDVEKAEVPMRDVWSNPRPMAALDGANAVLGDAGCDSRIPKSTRSAGILAACAQRVPADGVLAPIQRLCRQGRERLGQCSSQLAIQ